MADYNTSVNQTKNKSYNYDPNQSPVTLAGSASYDVFNYSEIYDNAEPETNPARGLDNSSGNSANGAGVWGITMGQSHNFTLYIKGVCEADNDFTSPSRNGRFLPLKQLDFKPVTLEHLKIKAGVFSDLPFFHRRRLGVLNCSMLDSHKSLLSQRMFQWYNSCVYSDGYVPYVDEMCREAEYCEFTHDGKIATIYQFAVMPEGEFSVGRNYEGESGTLTEYKFQLLIVSDIKLATNGGKWIEADWGAGFGEDADFELRTEARVFGQGINGGDYIFPDPAIADYTGKR